MRTPFCGDHGPEGLAPRADLSHVTATAEAVAGVLRGGEVIVLESTARPAPPAGSAS